MTQEGVVPRQLTNPRGQDVHQYDRIVRVRSERLTFHASLAASNAAGAVGHQYPEALVILRLVLPEVGAISS